MCRPGSMFGGGGETRVTLQSQARRGKAWLCHQGASLMSAYLLVHWPKVAACLGSYRPRTAYQYP